MCEGVQYARNSPLASLCGHAQSRDRKIWLELESESVMPFRNWGLSFEIDFSSSSMNEINQKPPRLSTLVFKSSSSETAFKQRSPSPCH